MSTQPPTPVEVAAAESNPFAVLSTEEPVRPASAGSESSSRSSTSSNEVVVVDSAKEEEEGERVEKVEEEEEEEEEEKPQEIQSKDEPSPVEAPVAPPEDKDGLTTLDPKPEVIPIPEKPTAAQVAKAAGHATDKITSRLPGCLAKTTAFVSRFNKLMSTATGTDRALMTTSYSLTALTAQLDRISQYRALAHSNNTQKVSVIPLGFFSYLLLARKQESSRLVAISTRLKALASLISDVRIFMRLWGLFGMYEWLVDTLRNPPKDMTLRKIAYLQIVVNILFQILENLAYLGQHKVLPIGKKKQNSYWLWSSRFWMAHVVLEFWRLKRDRDLSFKGKEKAESEKDPKWFEVADVMKNDGKKSVWLRQLWSNMAYAPLTVHWSLESGALTQLSVGTLGAIAGVIGLHQAWRRTV